MIHSLSIILTSSSQNMYVLHSLTNIYISHKYLSSVFCLNIKDYRFPKNLSQFNSTKKYT